jgi:NAD dependent epimerase/dehydratase family enzyme
MVNLRMARVLVSGASGPIGKALLPSLRTNGAHITRLVRDNAPPTYSDEQTIPWHPGQPLSADALSGFDAVIHLAGETIVGRWTESKKTKIRDSRVIGTRNLA